MLDEQWDAFVIFVNAYYAVQEAYDSARREGDAPAPGLDAFCRDANPFLWDGQSSAEEAIYEGFCASFAQEFEQGLCSAREGFRFARGWLATLEGADYGTELVASFDRIANEFDFASACSDVSRQLAARASRLERTPQDYPESFDAPEPAQPSQKDIDAVIALLANGDKDFEASLRARLKEGEE